MKANELRIENYVLDSYNGKITRINWQEIKWIQEVTDRYAPIVLTQEILLKCGFVAKNEYDYFCLNEIKISSSIMRCDTKERSCFYLYLGDENEILNNRIDYVHQLQNLYFALTNEELEIQL